MTTDGKYASQNLAKNTVQKTITISKINANRLCCENVIFAQEVTLREKSYFRVLFVYTMVFDIKRKYMTIYSKKTKTPKSKC